MLVLPAGLLAKKAVERGLSVKPYVKTSLSPGSGVVTYYLKESGVLDYLSQLGYVDQTVSVSLLCLSRGSIVSGEMANTHRKNNSDELRQAVVFVLTIAVR